MAERGSGRVVALVPAHNEADRIGATLASLRAQGCAPSRVVVVADNCTDDTVTVARSAGAEVFETVANTDKKAGALNQALARLLPSLEDADHVLVADADSTLVPSFLEVAVRTLRDDPSVGAVGGVFLGEPGGGLLGALQRNEYHRYQRQIARRRDDAMVLTGTATVHRVDVLRRLVRDRGTVYDSEAITEDNEITLAIKHLGLRCVSPRECLVQTEVMATWRDLWHQRLRWQRGAIENLRAYGMTRVTLPYFGQQVGMAIGLVAMWLYVIFTMHLALTDQLGFHSWWLAIGVLFVLERVVTVWHAGARPRLLAAAFLPEWFFDLVLQAVLIRSAYVVLAGRHAEWHHGAS